MPDYVVREGWRVSIDYQIRESGERVTLDRERGDRMVERGSLEPVHQTKTQSKHSKSPDTKSDKEDDGGEG